MLTVQSLLFSPVQENTYLVYNEKGETLIIDPGCYFPEERSVLQEKIKAKGLKGFAVKVIVCKCCVSCG